MMMKAAIYYQFNGPIQIESVPAPTTCCCRRHDDDGVHIISISIGMVIQVMATGVCRSDWHGWKGHDADIRQHGLPFCPGHEFAGIVVEMSNSCTGNESSSGSGSSSSGSSSRRRRRRGIQIGDRVVVPFLLSCGTCRYCQAGRSTVCTRQQQPGFTYWGSFAEYVAIPQDRLQHVYVLPDAVSFVQAAALGCRFTTAYRAVLQQGNWEGILLQQQKQQQQQQQELPASMAVFGCGGVGLSCIMIAAAAAAKANADHHNNKKKRQPTIAIIAVDISQAALNKATSLGATHTVLIHPQDSHEDVLQQVLQCLQQEQHHHHQNDATVCTRSSNRSFKNVGITEVDGVDLAIDAAGFASTCEHAVYCTRCAGRMVQVGLPIDGTNDDGDGNVDDDDDSTTSTIGKSKLPVVPMGRVAGREIEIYGSHGFVSTDLEPLLQMIASGKLDPARLVEKCVTLREGIQALQDMDRSSPLGITMITSFQETSKL